MTFNYKAEDGSIKTGVLYLPTLDPGVDADDHASANYSPRSVLVDGTHVTLYTKDGSGTIKFNRKTRQYEEDKTQR